MPASNPTQQLLFGASGELVSFAFRFVCTTPPGSPAPAQRENANANSGAKGFNHFMVWRPVTNAAPALVTPIDRLPVPNQLRADSRTQSIGANQCIGRRSATAGESTDNAMIAVLLVFNELLPK